MKRYVWLGVTVVCMGAYASDNPFDLGTNLKKIDQEESALLSKLKQMSQKQKEEATAAKQHPETKEVTTATTAKVPEKNTPPQISEEESIQKIKDEQAEIDAAREKQAKAEQERLKKAEEERLLEEKREVAAYEARRAAKKKQEAEARLKAEKADMKKQNTKPAKEAVSGTQAKKEEIVYPDINISREEIEAVKAADRAYLEAIKEVDRGE